MHAIDKNGIPFEVRAYHPRDYFHLEMMYSAFYPKGKFQGMPPMKDEASRKWIKGLTEKGINFLACRDGKPVGHAVCLPDPEKDAAEYLIFVSHPNRNRGIGSALTQMAIRCLQALGKKSIWLCVGATNFHAIRLYRKFGFEFADECFIQDERKMIILL